MGFSGQLTNDVVRGSRAMDGGMIRQGHPLAIRSHQPYRKLVSHRGVSVTGWIDRRRARENTEGAAPGDAQG